MTWNDCALLKHNKAWQKAAKCTGSSFPIRRVYPGLPAGYGYKLCQFCFCTSVTTATVYSMCTSTWFPLEPCIWGQSDWTRGNVLKLKKSGSRFIIRKEFFILKAVRCRNTLSREAEDVPPLKVFKAWLGGALSSWKVFLPHGAELELDNLKGSFQPKLFYHSMKGEQKNAKTATEICTLTFLMNST